MVLAHEIANYENFINIININFSKRFDQVLWA